MMRDKARQPARPLISIEDGIAAPKFADEIEPAGKLVLAVLEYLAITLAPRHALEFEKKLEHLRRNPRTLRTLDRFAIARHGHDGPHAGLHPDLASWQVGACGLHIRRMSTPALILQRTGDSAWPPCTPVSHSRRRRCARCRLTESSAIMQAASLLRRSWHAIVHIVIAALALLALCVAGPPAVAQNNDGLAVETAGTASPTGAALVNAVLRHADRLRLSPEQARAIRLLRLDLQEKETRLAAERRALELQLLRQQASDPAGFKPADEVLRRIEQLGGQIERERHDTLQRALALLAAEQRSQIAQPPFPPLAPARGDEAGDARLDRQIAAALDHRLKDSKVVEYETSEAITNRLMDWAKTLGWLVGFPLAILAAVLALLGLKTYSDFRKLAESAGDEVRAEKEAANTEIKKLIGEADSLKPQLAAARQQVEEIAALKQSMSEVTAKVERIEKAVTFHESEALTPELRKSLESTIEAYRQHLEYIGFPTEEAPVSVSVDPTLDNAHYKYESNEIVIGQALVRDPDVAVREYARHVLEHMHPDSPYTAILSGLADYLTCSFNDRAKFGEKSAVALNRLYGRKVFKHGYLRTMENQRTFAELDSQAEMHDVGEVWGSVFWAIRTLLGRNQADRLLLTAWKETPSQDDSPASFAAFAGKVVALARRDYAGYAADVLAVVQRRGLALAGKHAVSG